MNRPYTFCHILSALDGKITGPYGRRRVAFLREKQSVPLSL